MGSKIIPQNSGRPGLIEDIQGLILAIRGVQVMMDRDLARIYQVESKRLNEQVKRNLNRFPEAFRFQLSDEEKAGLVANCDRFKSLKHATANPYAFTEQGVAMLSAVLRSETAIQTSIHIINAFVAMRRFLAVNDSLLQRMDRLEKSQIAHEIKTGERFDLVFDALEQKSLNPIQGIFFEGQIFDAYVFVNDLLRQAKKFIVLIDNYVDDTVLQQLAKRRQGVGAIVLTKAVGRVMAQDLKKHNAQYPPITVLEFVGSHDRFLILDGEIVYHLGASLKDLGKKWFAFSKMDGAGLKVMEKVDALIRGNLGPVE